MSETGVERLLDLALGALADIAGADDMTLKIARHKAKRIYDEIRSAHPDSATERKAREILGECIQPDGGLEDRGTTADFFRWTPGEPMATLDGDFSAEQLEAIAWWMRSKT